MKLQTLHQPDTTLWHGTNSETTYLNIINEKTLRPGTYVSKDINTALQYGTGQESGLERRDPRDNPETSYIIETQLNQTTQFGIDEDQLHNLIWTSQPEELINQYSLTPNAKNQIKQALTTWRTHYPNGPKGKNGPEAEEAWHQESRNLAQTIPTNPALDKIPGGRYRSLTPLPVLGAYTLQATDQYQIKYQITQIAIQGTRKLGEEITRGYSI